MFAAALDYRLRWFVYSESVFLPIPYETDIKIFLKHSGSSDTEKGKAVFDV